MKTQTIFDAYIKVIDDLTAENHLPNKRSLRQARKFQSAILRRLSEGDMAREALKMVEWVAPDDDSYCPWCGIYKVFGHKPNCPRQLALGINE